MHIESEQGITSDVKRLITLIRNKEVVLWAGSGLSLYAGYPSGQAFSNIICNAAKNENDKRILVQHKSVLMDVAEEFEQLYTRDELIHLVSDCFDKAPCVLPKTHCLCTQIPQINTIITTNYDHLFEIAYQGKLNTVIGTEYNVPNRELVTLYKIHGDSSNSASVVLTSKDYAQFYDKLDSLVWNKLKVILAEHSVLFIGYSFEDKNIEDIFEKVLSQIDTSKSEFFIAVPSLASYKLKHLNSICKTTHLPLDGGTLLNLIEKAVRENIVFDAIEKKVSIDQAQSVAYEHGIQPIWRSIPSGRSTELSVDGYISNPFKTFKFNGAQFCSSKETYQQMKQFIDDCDCRELILPAKDVKLFENVNGINVPQSMINGKKPNVVKIKKPEQVDKAILSINGRDVYKDSITIRSFWGYKRKRVEIGLSNINLSLLYENDSVNITLSFTDSHTSKGTLCDLSILLSWHDGATLVFSHRVGNEIQPILYIPPAEDKSTLAMLSNFINQNAQVYHQIAKLEEYLKKDFSIPSNLTSGDRKAIVKLLSVFDPQEVGNNFDLQLKCDSNMYENLKTPAASSLDITEQGEETIFLFGSKYIIREKHISIISPIIENFDEVGRALLLGAKPIAKVISSTGHVIINCKF